MKQENPQPLDPMNLYCSKIPVSPMSEASGASNRHRMFQIVVLFGLALGLSVLIPGVANARLEASFKVL